jgi:hypothetical protein
MKFSLKNNSFEFNFDSSNRPVQAFNNEIENTCESINLASIVSGKPIWLMLSGGIDSELIARTFLKLRIPFSCLIVRFDDDINKHDIDYAINFVQINNIPHKIHNMNVVQFINDCRGRTNPKCNLIYRYMQIEWMWLVNNMGGLCVIGSGEQRYNQNKVLKYTYGQFIPLIWQRDNNIDAIPYFFLQNSAIINSFANEAIQFKGEVGDLGHNIKKSVFSKFWPEIKERPKYHGYEKIKNLRKFIEIELTKQYPYMDNSITFTAKQIIDKTKYQ